MEQRYLSLTELFGSIPKSVRNSNEMVMWNRLYRHFADNRIQITDLNFFLEEVQRFYHNEIGQWLCRDTGPVMAQSGFPVLCSRLVEMGILEDGKAHFVVPVTLYPGKESLLLPYEFLPELTQLRSDKCEINEPDRHMLGLDRLYYVTTYHYRGHRELIDYYSLDVEDANDRHYQFSRAAGEQICRQLYYHPRALLAALEMYYRNHGGPALEKLIRGKASATFHY